MTSKITVTEWGSMNLRLASAGILDVLDLLHELVDDGSIIVKQTYENETPY